MDKWTLYYNPKCGSCRKALDILKKKKIQPEIIEYLKNPPTASDLANILKATGGDINALLRKREPIYTELKLDRGKRSSEAWFKIIQQHPLLLQRPIVIHGSRGVVARPPEEVGKLF